MSLPCRKLAHRTLSRPHNMTTKLALSKQENVSFVRLSEKVPSWRCHRSADFPAFAFGFGAVASKRSGGGQVCWVVSRLAGKSANREKFNMRCSLSAPPIWKSAISRFGNLRDQHQPRALRLRH